MFRVIFKDKILCAYEEIKEFNDSLDYIVLDRLFISDPMYYDTINLFNGKMDYNTYMGKYSNMLTKDYLYSEIGLLKEKKQ